jgi:hypothetical protein
LIVLMFISKEGLQQSGAKIDLENTKTLAT